MPTTGASLDVILLNSLGNRPSSADCLNTFAMVNCQPSKEPKQDITIKPITIFPTVGVNILANANPNGAELFTKSFAGTSPNMILVDNT